MRSALGILLIAVLTSWQFSPALAQSASGETDRGEARSWKATGTGVGALGLMLLASAAAYASAATEDEEAYERAGADNEIYGPEVEALLERGEDRARRARWLGGVGAGALVLGVASYVYGKSLEQEIEIAPLAPVESSTAATGLSLRVSF
jgi:hypothetical protein